MTSLLADNRTLYIRNPKKNYAFERIGEIVTWQRSIKMIQIQGRLYTVFPVN